jgi:hypothetical protein
LQTITKLILLNAQGEFDGVNKIWCTILAHNYLSFSFGAESWCKFIPNVVLAQIFRFGKANSKFLEVSLFNSRNLILEKRIFFALLLCIQLIVRSASCELEDGSCMKYTTWCQETGFVLVLRNRNRIA